MASGDSVVQGTLDHCRPLKWALLPVLQHGAYLPEGLPLRSNPLQHPRRQIACRTYSPSPLPPLLFKNFP